MNDANDLNNLSKFDLEMLEAIDKIAAGQPHSVPASDLYNLGNYLANIEVPARPAFRQQLEAALLAELAEPTPAGEFSPVDYVLPVQPVIQIIQPTKNQRPALRLKFPGWRRLLLVGMAATILLLVGVIRFAVLTSDPLGPTPGAAVQPVQTVPPTATLAVTTVAPTVIIAPTATPVPIAPATLAPAPVSGTITQNYKIELKIGNPNVTKSQLDAARQIIEQRLKGLQPGQVRILTFDSQFIRLEVYGVANIEQLLQLITSPGRLEVIDSGDQQLAEGEQVYTSAWLKWAEANDIPVREKIAQNPAKSFETVLDSGQLELARGLTEQTLNRATGATILYARLKTESVGVLVKYSRAYASKQFTVVQDGKVLNTFSVNPEVSDRIQITSNSWNTPQSKIAITNLILMLQSGVLPLELSVQSSQPF